MIRNISTFLLVIGFAFIASYYYPHLTVSPGSVQEYHKKHENNCSKCHTPFNGVNNADCLNCHNVDDSFKEKKNAGAEINVKTVKSLSVINLHKVIKDTSCYRCHPEHEAKHLTPAADKFHEQNQVIDNCQNCHIKPENKVHQDTRLCESCHNTKNWQKVQFSHRADQKDCVSCHRKPASKVHESSGTDCGKCHNTNNWGQAVFKHKENQKDCVTCHKTPQNILHEQSGQNCGKCHNTSNWKDAQFQHTMNQTNCVSCHTKPADSFHSLSGSDCGKCHTTTNWKSANFDHSRFFKLSGHHRARCGTCHNEGSYKTFTCYGCHKHSEAGVNRKHTRIGLKNFDKCTDCHRSGSEKQAWQNLKKLQGSKYDTTTEATRKKKSKKSERSRDDHDRKKQESREHHDNDDDDD